jgi:hypothetical protein
VACFICERSLTAIDPELRELLGGKVTYREGETQGYDSAGEGDADPSSAPKKRKSSKKGKKKVPKEAPGIKQQPSISVGERAAVGPHSENEPMPPAESDLTDGGASVTPGATSSEQEPPPESDSSMRDALMRERSGASSKCQATMIRLTQGLTVYS